MTDTPIGTPVQRSPRGEQIDLDICWTWVCPGCKQRNYHHGSQMRDPEMAAQACEELGVHSESELCLMPSQVFCARCETRYTVKDPGDGG